MHDNHLQIIDFYVNYFDIASYFVFSMDVSILQRYVYVCPQAMICYICSG